MRRNQLHRWRSAGFRRLLLCWLLLLPPVTPAATPAGIMSQAMLVMMDALGDLALRYKHRGNWSFGGRYSPYGSLYGLSGYPLDNGLALQDAYPAAPFNRPRPGVSPVDGVWLGTGGEIVLVVYGHFRIYASADVYRDGLFTITGDRLVMYDPRSEHRMVFAYYLENGHMLLRGGNGTVLAFKQLPIPIPPWQ